MTPLTAEEAKDALRRAAWRGDIFRGPMVHSMGSFGCDVSLAHALDEVDKAVAAGGRVGWVDRDEAPLARAMGHHLVVGDYFYSATPDDDPLPDPPPPDEATLTPELLAGWLHDEAHGKRHDMEAFGDHDPTSPSWTLTHGGRTFEVSVREVQG